MAAPERFAEMSDSSCTAGAVHTWHFSEVAVPMHDVGCWGKTGSGQRRRKPTRLTHVRHARSELLQRKLSAAPYFARRHLLF